MLRFGRLLNQAAAEQNQVRAANGRNLYPCRGPGESRRLGNGHGRENRDGIGAAPAGVASEIFVALAHRHDRPMPRPAQALSDLLVALGGSDFTATSSGTTSVAGVPGGQGI